MTEHSLLQHRDLEIRLDANLANSFLAALEFPLRLEFPEDELEELELEVSNAHTPDAPHDLTEDGIEAVVEDVLVQPLADHLDNNSTSNPPAKTETAGRYQVRVCSLVATLLQPPKMHLGNPVVLRDVALEVQAELKVGIRVLGKWHWKNTATRLNFEGRKARLELKADGSRLLVLPELEDTDVVMRLAIWKWQLKCKFGVSHWINQQLAKRGPFPVVDFADVQRGKILGKTPEFTVHSIIDGSDFLRVKADIVWK